MERESIVEVLQERDGVTAEDAQQQWDDFKERFDEMLLEGADHDEMQTALEEDFGLEPDYLDEFLF